MAHHIVVTNPTGTERLLSHLRNAVATGYGTGLFEPHRRCRPTRA